MDLELIYDVALPTRVADILDRDFWLHTDLTAALVRPVTSPVKFSAAVSVYVERGEATIEINLREYHITGPCLVNIRSGDILMTREVSDDFHGSFLVMSREFTRSVYMYVSDVRTMNRISSHPVMPVPAGTAPLFDDFYVRLKALVADEGNVNRYNAVLFSVLGFYFSTGWQTYAPLLGDGEVASSRLSDRFLRLVEENFRTERFLDFYAAALAVTPKHLSRAIKAQTGQSAAEWIERYVILEAKVLLKSSTLNVQQIAEKLNFPSQSFFGKYFKKCTGISPKEFRNR